MATKQRYRVEVASGHVKLMRVLAALGRTMIAAGILLLLFVAYQLWGTGFHTRAAQNELRGTFDEMLEEREPAKPIEPERADPETAPTEELAPPEPGEPIGQIQIPAIGVDFIVLEGVDLPILNDGPGHFPETPLPGQPGNAAIAGHRTTFAAPFNRLDELSPGDEIEVTTLQGTFSYEVMAQAGVTEGEQAAAEQGPAVVEAGPAHYVVRPDAVEILADRGDDRLTLMACHPKYSAAERIVVEAELVGAPAPPTPRTDEAIEGTVLLANEDTQWLQVALWAAAAALLACGAWLAGRVWRRWPSYLLATPPMLVLLFFLFENVTTVLPAAY